MNPTVYPDASPDTADTTDFDSGFEDGPNFRFFREKRVRVLDETEISFRASQRDLDEEIGVPDNWEHKEAEVKAYIDDLNVIEKVRHVGGISTFSVNKPTVHAHAVQSENYFGAISTRAAELDMRVNAAKTQVLCISSTLNSRVDSYLNTPDQRISSSDTLKILGFWFGIAPGVGLHVEKTLEKVRKRLWLLRHLKRSGMSTNDLIFIYELTV